MDNNQIDTALVERVALAMRDLWYDATKLPKHEPSEQDVLYWKLRSRAVIYPPAPPKTRLQVARELFAKGELNQSLAASITAGNWDDTAVMKAIIAALVLPAMED